MIDDILMQLSRVRGVGGTLVLTNDGQVVSGVLRQDVDDAQLAAAIAVALGNAQRVTDTLKFGRTAAIHLQGASGAIVVMPAGGSWLAIAVDPGANLALLQLEARPFVEKLGAALSL